MNRFERVIHILDAAVGGVTASVAFHGAFWRGLTRDQFVARKVLGQQLVVVGDPIASKLVAALRGRPPFGADLEQPPEDAQFNRMPSGRPPVAEADIAFIERWIAEGCLEDEVAVAPAFRWEPTNAPIASSRTDDVFFIDPDRGWAVNSDGKVLKTVDGGASWEDRVLSANAYLRCVAFANANVGWVGTLTKSRRLFATKDGGATWKPVTGLPAEAPAAVCGISVVSADVVYAAGTNRPTDVPAMMKTTDGGATWRAWSMSAHASVLIDTHFSDENNGWVVGGKADEPTPTSRDKLKPVVLQTTDGGKTWVNRLAGQAAMFPFGEWGWKIHFLNATTGFASLENMTAGAILKTVNGGATWERLAINDPQQNANLEGVGFIDADNGWVGGWGNAEFTGGFSSVTHDGGKSWQDANEIGRFLNRFRFFGRPVSVGYASGDTVYKYTDRAAGVPRLAARIAQRPLIPDPIISAGAFPVGIRLVVPRGTKRLTILAWDRFGVEFGALLDEVHPAAGTRTFEWDGTAASGDRVMPTETILRVLADDVIASTIVRFTASRKLSGGAEPGSPSSQSRAAIRAAPPPRAASPSRTMSALLAAEAEHTIDWLKAALQLAIQLELATLPPYLTARWTIKNANDPVARSIREVTLEEMAHFGHACNLLVAIGGVPLIADPAVIPKYPGPLPGGVRPHVVVGLEKLSKAQAKVFMDIEYPEDGPLPVALRAQYDAIGLFYNRMRDEFLRLKPRLDTSRQIESALGLFKIDTLDKVVEAIEIIKKQGEGSKSSPEEQSGDLAHYYRFAEIEAEARLVQHDGVWKLSGPALPLPEVWPMAPIPAGGYQRGAVPDVGVWSDLEAFDRSYSRMLVSLELAWQHGNENDVGDAIIAMMEMGSLGKKLVKKPLPDGSGNNYGPCFRFVADETD